MNGEQQFVLYLGMPIFTEQRATLKAIITDIDDALAQDAINVDLCGHGRVRRRRVKGQRWASRYLQRMRREHAHA